MFDEQWRNFIQVMEANHEIGSEIYDMLNQYTGQGTEIMVCPMHIGDTVLMTAFAEDYKRQKQLNKLIVVSHTVPPETLELFPGVDAGILLDTDQMGALQFFMTVHGLRYANGIRFAYHWNLLQIENARPTYTVLLNERILLSDLIRQILDLDSSAKMRCMQIPEDGKKREYDEKYQNAVMLMPGTLTEKNLPVAFWERLAKQLQKMGYEVYTNYNGKPCETMVEGTTALSSTLKEMASMAEAFRLFIGVRSGACDLMALSGARMAVIFTGKPGEDHVEMKAEDRPNGWLGDVEDGAEIRHFLYLPDMEEQLIEKICEMLSGGRQTI